MTQDFCMVSKPTIAQRLWRGLGFAACGWPDMPEREGFVPGHLSTHVIAVLDWRDRLRVLASGKVMVASSTQTDVLVNRATTLCNVSVLPPNYPVQGP